MVRLEAQPVTVPPTSGVWSHTLILSDSRLLDSGEPPAWIIALSLTGEDVELQGPHILEEIDTVYRASLQKLPEELFVTLKNQIGETTTSIAAVCLTSEYATLYCFGQSEIHLWRSNRHGLVLANTTPEWHVIEGPALMNDKWWIIAGDAGNLSVEMNELVVTGNQSLESISESMQTRLADTLITTLATVLIFITPSPSPSIGVTEIDTLTIADQTISTIPAKPISPGTLPISKLTKRHRVMLAGWLVLALLIISVWIGARARVENQLSKQYTLLEKKVNDTVSAAKALQPADQIQARDQLRQLEESVKQAEPIFIHHPSWLTKWSNLNTQVTTAYQSLAGETNLSQIPIWFTLSVVRPNLTGDQLQIVDHNLIILDKASNTLIQIGTDTKRADVIAGGDNLKGATSFASSPSRALVLADSGIVDISLSRKTTSIAIPHDDGWQQITATASFNGNLYLLDQGSGDIWRYPAVSQGFGARERWLGKGVTVSDGSITGLAVDGDVWLLKTSGTLLRFRRGAPLSYTMSGLDTPLSNATSALAVSSDQDLVAILDQGNSRVILLNKQGVYQKQVKWAELAQAQSIALSADGTTLYILKGGSIYSTNFQPLTPNP